MQASNILPIALQGLAEGPWAGHVDEKSVLKGLENCILAGSLFVALEDNKPIGFLAATALPGHLILGPVRCAAELALYVLPEYRHKGHGIALMRQFEKWAKDTDCKHIFMGKHRRGYKPMEQLHWKVI